uniref:SFRICE_022448 n=1 Tax=Spodoptera frugiperda TaxID=7108 RepID=A0A2H1W7F4_SPOFR
MTNSDTESAVGGRERSRLAGLSARVRAVLPRAKDKVQATEAQTVDTEDKKSLTKYLPPQPLSDDKKGVVYAELALGEQTSTEKPPPPSTEYAEIVYTDQPKDTKESN